MTDPHNLGTDELLALLRDPSLKPESIVEEIECAGAKAPQGEQVVAARALLAELTHAGAAHAAGLEPAADLPTRIAALPELLGLAVVHAAGQGGQSEVLRHIAQGKDKAQAKEAKRALQRLKQKGVQVPELKLQGAPVLRPLPEAEAPPCYASSIDAYGERAVWWARASRSGVEVVQAVVSDVKGILAVDALAMSRKSFREFVKRLPRQGVVTSVEIPKDHARHLIALAADAGARGGFSTPPTYVEALRTLGPAPEPAPPAPSADIDMGPDGEAPHALAGAALFQDPLFASWIPDEETLRGFALRVEEIATSQLYVDEAQRREAFGRAAEEAADAYFTPPRRARHAHRLSEMAHVLSSEGRVDAARTALAVSRALASGAKNPFCAALFAHALEGRLSQPAAPPAPQPRPSGLITP